MAKQGNRKVGFKAVVQLPLTPELVEAVMSLGDEDHAVMWESVVAGVVAGIKFGLTYDPERKLFGASAFDQAADSPNAGLIVFANGATASLAIAALVYKLRYVAGGRSWSEASGPGGTSTVS